MKRIKNFIPLKKKIIIFIKNFIKDLIEALIGFFIGKAIEAIIDLEIFKAIVFIIFYFIFAIIKNNFQETIKDKVYFKNNRGIKVKNQLKAKNIFERGLYIICIILFSRTGLSLLFMIIHLIWRVVYTNYYILRKNLICSFNESKSLNS